MSRLLPKSDKQFRIGVIAAVSLTIGTLFVVALGIVLFFSLGVAQKNTFALYAQQADLTSRFLDRTIGDPLRTAQRTVDLIGDRLEKEALEETDPLKFGFYLRSALQLQGNLFSLLFLSHDKSGHLVFRQNGLLRSQVTSFRHDKDAELAIRKGKTLKHSFWGRVLFVEGNITIINVRRPVWRNGKFIGLVIASVRLSQFSKTVVAATKNIGGTAFVLYDDKFVLAHPTLKDGYPDARPGKPLPAIADIADPILKAFTNSTKQARGLAKHFENETGMRLVFDDKGDGYPFIVSEIEALDTLPIKLGVYYDTQDSGAEIRRLWGAFLAGFAVLALGLLGVYFAAKRFTEPLRRFAVGAEKIARSEFSDVPTLPGSRIREVDEVTTAFNAMVRGLRWMDAYVPHHIVSRLMHLGQDAKVSEQRNATVLFTDIADFTERSHAWSAEETADFLNAHFALLIAEIEKEGGIVDKFLGDGLMAFWESNGEDGSYAANACRAAIAIRNVIAIDNEQRRAANQEPVCVRMGLHSGPAVIGNIGVQGRLNFTAVGDTVNFASRLEQYLKEVGTEDMDKDVAIAASAVTVETGHMDHLVQATGLAKLRGADEPFTIHYL